MYPLNEVHTLDNSYTPTTYSVVYKLTDVETGLVHELSLAHGSAILVRIG